MDRLAAFSDGRPSGVRRVYGEVIGQWSVRDSHREGYHAKTKCEIPRVVP
jgi:hypothetical protein